MEKSKKKNAGGRDNINESIKWKILHTFLKNQEVFISLDEYVLVEVSQMDQNVVCHIDIFIYVINTRYIYVETSGYICKEILRDIWGISRKYRISATRDFYSNSLFKEKFSPDFDHVKKQKQKQQ